MLRVCPSVGGEESDPWSLTEVSAALPEDTRVYATPACMPFVNKELSFEVANLQLDHMREPITTVTDGEEDETKISENSINRCGRWPFCTVLRKPKDSQLYHNNVDGTWVGVSMAREARTWGGGRLGSWGIVKC